jgi:large subunit ribosomal protein L28
MSRVCEMCGKGPIVVNSVIRRGKARAAGGVGRKVTGVSKTRQLPNLQRVTIRQSGVSVRLKICTKCMKNQLAA